MKASGRKLATLAVLISLVTPFSYASELVIAQPASATAMDPGFLKEAATLVDNIFDTLVPISAAALISPVYFVRDILLFDLPYAFFITLVVLFLFARKRGLQKREAVIVLALYFGYVIYKLTQL